jgi:hypothetical protein
VTFRFQVRGSRFEVPGDGSLGWIWWGQAPEQPKDRRNLESRTLNLKPRTLNFEPGTSNPRLDH